MHSSRSWCLLSHFSQMLKFCSSLKTACLTPCPPEWTVNYVKTCQCDLQSTLLHIQCVPAQTENSNICSRGLTDTTCIAARCCQPVVTVKVTFLTEQENMFPHNFSVITNQNTPKASKLLLFPPVCVREITFCVSATVFVKLLTFFSFFSLLQFFFSVE